jgi:pyrroloquinoline quinone biosynthesis protein D
VARLSERPSLAHGVILRHDDTRGVDMVLAPERVVELSRTAAAIVELCDGSHTLADIVAALCVVFDGSGIEDDVKRLVTRMTEWEYCGERHPSALFHVG